MNCAFGFYGYLLLYRYDNTGDSSMLLARYVTLLAHLIFCFSVSIYSFIAAEFEKCALMGNEGWVDPTSPIPVASLPKPLVQCKQWYKFTNSFKDLGFLTLSSVEWYSYQFFQCMFRV
jgi:hypothetical protein